MKIEWGKKICCPACALPFYDLWKTLLVCPYCGHTVNSSELLIKKTNAINIEEEANIDNNEMKLGGFEFENDEESSDMPDDEITDEIDELKISDME
ncbi:MAG: FYDLN acid domain-containing protein [Holosporales bacterium]|jgi:uncharacterized protein (TIGR02300 family)|nr:FYDLN acid domain-containing protein [Holosporales bacterium]